MSKKPFEHIENRVREAAENSEPPFDELAWQKMESLLDKEDEKKRPFLWLWFTLPVIFIASIGAYIFISKKQPSGTTTANTNNQAIVQKQTSQQQPNSVSANDQQKNTVADNSSLSVNNNTAQSENNITQQTNSIQNFNSNPDITGVQVITNGNGKAKKTKRNIKASINTTQKNEEVSELNNDVAKDGQNKAANVQNTDAIKNTSEIINAIKISTRDSVLVKTKTPEKNIVEAKNNDAKKATAKQKLSKFYLLASIGIDASSVQLFSFKNSTLSPRYGIGAGFQLTNKISVQTGFYAGHKQYIAGPNDYHAKYGTYLDSVDITKVNANCLIFEIPVSIRYNFLQKPSVVYYVTAGISSFIMKNENYNYNYVVNNNSYATAYTYTGNKNLFSILTLSAGIEKKLTSKFSLQAEPSINIPIAGVGEGNVKLYSTGIQVGIKYIP